LAELRAAEEEILGSYSWAEKEKNVVRIPIERAMELIAERGLPARKQPKRIRDERAASDQQSGISSDPIRSEK
jgi:hypothetical protein